MNTKILVAATAAALALVATVHAQQLESYKTNEPGRVGEARSIKATASIVSIDAATREVTLKGPQGREITVVAGPDVRNFDALKAGDKVDIQYVEAVTVELKKGGGLPVGAVEESAKMGAAPGATPAGASGRQVTVVGDVIDLDPATQRVTVRGAKHTVDVTVRDPEQFKRIARGDQLQATYIEAVALELQPAAK